MTDISYVNFLMHLNMHYLHCLQIAPSVQQHKNKQKVVVTNTNGICSLKWGMVQIFVSSRQHNLVTGIKIVPTL